MNHVTLDDGDVIKVHQDGATVLIGHNNEYYISPGCTVEPQQVMYRRIVQLKNKKNEE